MAAYAAVETLIITATRITTLPKFLPFSRPINVCRAFSKTISNIFVVVGFTSLPIAPCPSETDDAVTIILSDDQPLQANTFFQHRCHHRGNDPDPVVAL